ncbi:DUF2101 family protein [Methanobacterium alcaliphilum]|uniref:DUF2101 family protein n=1 Tax=Methanobacterium alcaliphilum TaxID=392018 RepID=UPI00200AD1A1|nr:DUF2101 family protein [Methanobacterium alcaliphilum]MCK9150657.1 DUF2101 family protein [Methanobacterium alcaliphilum]
MSFFSRFGDIIISIFSFTGTIVIEIIKLPSRIKNLDLKRTGPEKVKETVNQIKNEEIVDKISNMTKRDEKYSPSEELKNELKNEEMVKVPKSLEESDGTIMIKGLKFSSKEKENTILRLQIMAGSFLIVSVLFVFNFISFIIFAIVGLALVALTVYTLYNKIKLMYPDDFNAYRDFFLMYIAVGFILVIVAGNSAITMAFPFQFFPSFSVLIFALLAVLAVFLIFRIRYHRDFTYGEIIEVGSNTSHVKVEYDIQSNVKPDLYLVENNGIDLKEGEQVKLEVRGSTFNMNGNKPVKIIEKVHDF